MANYVDIQLVLGTIKSQSCDRLWLWDIARQNLLGRFEGTPAELCDELQNAYGYIHTVFRVEVMQKRLDRNRAGTEARGAKAVEQMPFVYLLGDRGAAGRGDNGGNVPLYQPRKRDRDDDDENDDDDDDDEPDNSAEKATALLEKFMPLVERVLDRLVPPRQGITGTAQPATAGNSDAPTHPATPDTPDEVQRMRDIGAAIANLRKTDPAAFQQYSQLLINNYGTKK